MELYPTQALFQAPVPFQDDALGISHLLAPGQLALCLGKFNDPLQLPDAEDAERALCFRLSPIRMFAHALTMS